MLDAQVGAVVDTELGVLLKTTGDFGVQQEGTATSPDSRQLTQPSAH